MATQMHPDNDSHVFGAATDEESLVELKRLELEVLEDGHIGGLNGVLLGVAAERACTGHAYSVKCRICSLNSRSRKRRLPSSKPSRRSRESRSITTELAEQAGDMEQELGKLLSQVEGTPRSSNDQPDEEIDPARDQRKRSLGPEDRKHIEQLFEQAERDRSNAYELKRELDRLGVYREYEDRFLDLFKKPG